MLLIDPIGLVIVRSISQALSSLQVCRLASDFLDVDTIDSVSVDCLGDDSEPDVATVIIKILVFGTVGFASFSLVALGTVPTESRVLGLREL